MHTRLMAVAIALLGVAAPLEAQVSVDIGPLYAAYHPLNEFTSIGLIGQGFPPRSSDLRGAASGVSLQTWFGAAGLRLTTVSRSAGFVQAAITPEGPAGPFYGSARVGVTTLEGQYDVLERLLPGPVGLWLGAGASYVRHAGWTYAQTGNPSDFGDVVGVGASARLPLGFVAKAGSDLVMYQFYAPFKSAGVDPGYKRYPTFQRGYQRDAITYISLSWGPPRF